MSISILYRFRLVLEAYTATCAISGFFMAPATALPPPFFLPPQLRSYSRTICFHS